MRIRSTASARAALCLLAAALLVTGCTSRKPPKLILATTTGGAAGGYDLAGTLPDQPTHAHIYLWSAPKQSQADVEKLASALGLHGTPTRHARGWELTTADGELRVRDDQGQAWYYSRADLGPCPAVNLDIDNAPGEGPHYDCASLPPAPPPTKGPYKGGPQAAADSLLTALGVGNDAPTDAGMFTSSINVAPKIAGLRTHGIEMHIDVDVYGVTVATGHLAPTAGAEYPLRTAKAALDSLSSPFGPVNSSGPIEIAGAYLGLDVEANPTPVDPTILVPTWFFTLADRTVAATAIAIDPAYIGSPPGPAIVTTGGGA